MPSARVKWNKSDSQAGFTLFELLISIVLVHEAGAQGMGKG